MVKTNNNNNNNNNNSYRNNTNQSPMNSTNNDKNTMKNTTNNKNGNRSASKSENNSSNKTSNKTSNNSSNKSSNNGSSKLENKVKSGMSGIQNKATNIMDQIKPSLEKSKEAISSGIEMTSTKLKETYNQTTSSGVFATVQNISNDFQSKNSIVAKMIFVFFVFVIFTLLMKLGVYLLGLAFSPSKNPIVVDGMLSTLTNKTYNVNPNSGDPNPILRSINEDMGMEFTWSTWVWINSVDYADDAPRIFFSKGQSVDTFSSSSMKTQFVMNSPGLYVYDSNKDTGKINSLSVVVSFFDEAPSTSFVAGDQLSYDVITVGNIPMQKWVNVVMRVQGRIVDIYINGTLSKRKTYERVVKQNYGNIYVGSQTNGVDGYISSLRYYDHAIGNNTIQDILYGGPNLNMVGTAMTDTSPPYLALTWYLEDD